jgi:hypothetical protein
MVENHWHAMALHFMYDHFGRIHQTLKMTPVMAAGVTKRLWEIGDILDVANITTTPMLSIRAIVI